MSTNPTRRGNAWTKEEESRVLQCISEGMMTTAIAELTQRTEGAIRSRLIRIACRLVDDGVPLQDASTRTGVEVPAIRYAIKNNRVASEENRAQTMKHRDMERRINEEARRRIDQAAFEKAVEDRIKELTRS